MTDTTIKTRRPRRMARDAQQVQGPAAEGPALDPAAVADPAPAAQPAPSKSARVIELLKRGEGATLDELIAATGWLPHTTRAALTGLKKKGHLIASEKVDNVRRYRITGAAA